MMIPKTIKIGKTKYPVLQPEMMLPPDHFGHVVCGKHIKVAYSWVENNRTKHRSEHQRSETFWHEVTHAILYDMGHKLESNEKFVTAFSQRLNDAIRSAKF